MLKKSIITENHINVVVLFSYEKGVVKILEVNGLPFYCYKADYIKKLHEHDSFFIQEMQDKIDYEAEMKCEDERVDNF
jgi:hypothetical protein